MTDILNIKDYISFLNQIKSDIQTSRVRAHLAVNKELILLYWRIGSEILKRQKERGWGTKVIDQLSQDLGHAFPDMRGLSTTNLKYMRVFASRFDTIGPQLVDQLPWGHIRSLIDRFENPELMLWYAQKTIENGWSRNVLMMQIESGAHLRLGQAKTNFKETLPEPTSDLAQQLMKSAYNFEFLGLAEESHEKIIEKGLIENIRNFLLELGSGFSFMGSQYRVTLAGEEFLIDLLFYHVKLRCYIVIELKAGKFKPEYAGKLSFYVTAIDREVKSEEDNPTIGLLLCQSSNDLMVEYCLSDTRKPIGVSEYRTLPKEYTSYLPTPDQFQHLMKTIQKPDEED